MEDMKASSPSQSKPLASLHLLTVTSESSSPSGLPLYLIMIYSWKELFHDISFKLFIRECQQLGRNTRYEGKEKERREKRSIKVLLEFPLLLLFFLFICYLLHLSFNGPFLAFCFYFSVWKLDWDGLSVSTLESSPCAMPAFSLGFLVPCGEDLCVSSYMHLCIVMG